MKMKKFIKYMIALPLAILYLLFFSIGMTILEVLFIWVSLCFWAVSDSERAEQGFLLYQLDMLLFVINITYIDVIKNFFSIYYENNICVWDAISFGHVDRVREQDRKLMFTFHKSLGNLNLFAYRCKLLFRHKV